ncbi:MYND finger domain-containing protein [Hirsutella rhossiliensis]
MATCNVSVEFWCEFGATELKYKHSIPKTLVTQDALSTEGKVCRVCREIAGARRCSRCLAVAYCSRQHQKEDWKVHKKGCKPKAS